MLLLERNMNSLLLLLVCLLASQSRLANCILEHPGYIELNNYLTSVENNHFLPNLLAVREKLKNYKDYPDLQTTSPNLMLALQEVGELAHLPVDQPENFQCDLNELQILRTLAEKTDAHRYHRAPESDLTQLEFIIYQANTIHAIQCMPKYFGRFLYIYPTWINFRTNSYVENFMSQIAPKRQNQDSVDYLYYLLSRDLNMMIDSVHAAIHIRSTATARELESPAVAFLLNKYLYDPCNNFNEYFGLFEMILFEEKMFEYLSAIYIITNPKFTPYMIARATYLTCKAMRNNQEFNLKVLESFWGLNP